MINAASKILFPRKLRSYIRKYYKNIHIIDIKIIDHYTAHGYNRSYCLDMSYCYNYLGREYFEHFIMGISSDVSTNDLITTLESHFSNKRREYHANAVSEVDQRLENMASSLELSDSQNENTEEVAREGEFMPISNFEYIVNSVESAPADPPRAEWVQLRDYMEDMEDLNMEKELEAYLEPEIIRPQVQIILNKVKAGFFQIQESGVGFTLTRDTLPVCISQYDNDLATVGVGYSEFKMNKVETKALVDIVNFLMARDLNEIETMDRFLDVINQQED